MKKLMMKLQARQPPQKNGVELMAMTPESESEGINTNISNRISPTVLARTGCLPKMRWQMAEFLFRVEKPISAPKNAPKNKVTDMATSCSTSRNLNLIITNWMSISSAMCHHQQSDNLYRRIKTIYDGK